ncbi:AAA family ATPase [Mycobacterium kansasii]|uniref:AAA family ATPase n=1 Tax=Mycobacterium kansasii TaxID=1768 RepID=UPI0015E1E983|nr:AAA family ATPase [Mycobacterium kansasii]
MNAIRNGTWLENQVFPEPAWSVPGIIPEGCCILAGPPKIGKSFLVLAIALAAASGNRVLGVEVQHRPVLYLALEDNARRLQNRTRMLLDDDPFPHEFYCLTRESAERAIDLARDWVREQNHRGPLVIVDTLEKVRGQRGNNPYADDYRAGTSLRSLLTPNGSVIAVHHTRKGTSDDFLDDVSGTLGLAGSFDTVITLKRTRNSNAGTLSVTGRDVEEMTYQLSFADGAWTADGGSLAAAAVNATRRKLGEKMQQVLELVNARPETTAAEVVIQTQIPHATARQYLHRLADEHGLITRLSTGAYGPVTVSQVSREQDRTVSGDDESAKPGDSGEVPGVVDRSQDEPVLSGP